MSLTVVTGGTSGLGEATARQLVGLGHEVVITARDRASGAAALARTGASHAVVADLSLMREVASMAEQILGLGMPVRAVVLNAAVALREAATTDEGLGVNYATNVLGPLLLEQRLRPQLAEDGRVVVLGSSQHSTVKSLDLDEAPLVASYTESKLLVMLAALDLSRRAESAPTCIADPGFVRTNLGRHSRGAFAVMLRLTRPFQVEPESAAATSVWLADAPDASARNGGYFAKSKPTALSPLAQDTQLARRAFNQALQRMSAWL